MTNSLTTGQCADILNELVGMRAYSSDFIRGEVDAQQLRARVNKPRGIQRQRAYLRIHVDDLRTYVAENHADLLAAFHAKMAHDEQRIA